VLVEYGKNLGDHIYDAEICLNRSQRHKYGLLDFYLIRPAQTSYAFMYFISVNMMGSQHV